MTTGGFQPYLSSSRAPGRPEALESEHLNRTIRRAVSDGLSDREAAKYADCTERTVLRYRTKHGIPSNFPSGHKKKGI